MIAITEIIQQRQESLKGLSFLPDKEKEAATLKVNKSSILAVRDYYLQVRADSPEEHRRWRNMQKFTQEPIREEKRREVNLEFQQYFNWLEPIAKGTSGSTVSGPAGQIVQTMTTPSSSETLPFETYNYTNPDGSKGGRVAKDAQVDPTAIIHESAVVGPKSKIGPRVRLGPRVTLESHVTLLDGVNIGEGTIIGDRCRFSYDAKIGKRNNIAPFVYIGFYAWTGDLVSIGFGADIGAGTGTYVADRAKVGNFGYLNDRAFLEPDEILFAGERKAKGTPRIQEENW